MLCKPSINLDQNIQLRPYEDKDMTSHCALKKEYTPLIMWSTFIEDSDVKGLGESFH
jgi:hypothetical protein